MGVRTPPRPPFERQKGKCALCGEPPPPPKKSWCSKVCVDTWWLATDSGFQLHHLLALHGPVCWGCGEVSEYRRHGGLRLSWIGPKLEVEHVRPLWSLTPDERLELRWWLPGNLQLLCVPCHRRKTAREAADRAALRRPTQPPVEPTPNLFDLVD